MSDLPDLFSNLCITTVVIAPANAEGIATKTEIAPASTNPYLVYLSQLAFGSRRTMRESLETIAQMMSEGELNAVNFP